MAAEDNTLKIVVVLGVAGVGLWWLYEQGYLYQWTGMASLYPGTLPTSTTTGGGTTSGGTTSGGTTGGGTTGGGTTSGSSPAANATQCGGGLTVQDAATLEYSSEITADDMDCVSAALDQTLASGSITKISGVSVLAYMLGWGGASAGATQTTLGLTYKFDGTNWNLQSSGSSGIGMFAGTRIPIQAAHGMGFTRMRRGWLV